MPSQPARSGDYDQLARLLVYYQNAAEDVLTQMRVLARGEAPAPAYGLQDALKAASARHTRLREAAKPLDASRGLSRVTITRRAQTAAALAQFDPGVPKRPEDLPVAVPGLGSLVRRGYLRRAGDGYLRTEKEWFVHPTSAK